MNLSKPLMGLAVMLSASVSAHAAVVFDLLEVGPDVVLSGSGTLNLAGLTPVAGSVSAPAYTFASNADAVVGSSSFTQVDIHSGLAGPTSFGSGTFTMASSGSGNTFGVANGNRLVVPRGYVSGSLLSGTATFANRTFSSLGATPGTYTWSWGSGATADSMTLNVGTVTAVPEPSAYALALAGLGVLGIWGRRKTIQQSRQRQTEAAAA